MQRYLYIYFEATARLAVGDLAYTGLRELHRIIAVK